MTRAGARDLTVAVIGAGPAGATAARHLARQGAHVRLLEAKRLPRHKLCGGGLTPRALPYLPPAALPCVVRRVAAFELAGGRLGPLTLRLPGVDIALVERAPFDHALVGAAAAAGAAVEDGLQVLGLRPLDAGVEVETRSGRFTVDVVVAADGDPSRAAAQIGLRGGSARRSLALEVDLPLAGARDPDALELRFGIPSGYAWYFPKADHANVGILTADPRHQPHLRAMLGRYTRELGLPVGDARVRGHWIPQGLRRGPAVRGRVLLAGDAAGTADPFFGEGISSALASGVLAARTIGDWADGRIPSLRAYDRRLRTALAPGFARMSLVGAIADAIPTLSILGLRTVPWARNEARRGLLGLGPPFVLPPAEA